MASLFNREPKPKPPLGPYARERIEKEVEHLRKKGSVRHAGDKPRNSRAGWIVVLLFGALLWLFFMDPVLHGYHRDEAERVYLYLHHFGSERKAHELLATGIFSPSEIEQLDRRSGSFQDYYSDPGAGDRAADAIIQYLQGVTDLQNGSYDKLGPVGKLRYQLFIRFGIHPPTQWAFLNPSVHD
jgi:hypothetical protein